MGYHTAAHFLCSLVCAFPLQAEKNLMPIVQNFSGPAIGAVAAGIACASTTVIYQFDRIALRVKVRPHFAVGLGAFYPVEIGLKRFPFYPEALLRTVMQILIACGIFAAIWLVFFWFAHVEAKTISQRRKEMEKDDWK